MKRIFLFSVLSVLFCLMLSCKSSPTTPTPRSVAVTSPHSTIWVGHTEQMTATVTMSDGKTKPGTGTWGSDATSVATVNQSGVVTGISPGDVDIYFKETGGGEGSKRLTVQANTITSVAVTAPYSTIRVGQTEQMTATVTMSDGTTKPATGTWGSDATSVATVNQSGVVTGISPGDVDIYFNNTAGGQGFERLTVRNLWSISGVGDNVFDIPIYVSEVKITATYTHYSSNFIVWIGDNLVVNELMGTAWSETYFEGTYSANGRTVQIQYSSGVSWSFTEVPFTTAITNAARKRPNFTSHPDLAGNREYEIYKRASEGIR